MLEIIINDLYLELSEDIEVSLTIENPLMNTDRIPVPHTFSFDIPCTRLNLIALGDPDRIPSLTDFASKLPGEIRFAGYVIAQGEVVIEEVSEDHISLHFTGAVLPTNIRKQLQKQSFGKLSLGTVDRYYDHSGQVVESIGTATNTFNTHLKAQAAKVTPDYVAVPLRIDGQDFTKSDDSNPVNAYSNQRAMFVNAYDESYKFPDIDVPPVPGTASSLTVFAKIIPAFRVGWLLHALIGDKLSEATVFDQELARLMLVCTWHPTYQTITDAPVWNIDPPTGEVSVCWADYMPTVSASDFLCELLKLTCSSLYLRGGKYILESNSDTLNRPYVADWSDKLIARPAVSWQAGELYNYGYSNEDTHENTDRKYQTVATITAMMESIPILNPDAWPEDYVPESLFYHVISTGQYFEVYPDTMLSEGNKIHYSFKLLGTNFGSSPDREDDTSERGEFDMVINGMAVHSTIANIVKNNSEYVPNFDARGASWYPQCYCPLIDQPDKRSGDLLFGLWIGKHTLRSENVISRPLCPSLCLSHTGVAPDGSVVTDVSLGWNGPNGLLERYHKPYKTWVEKDKQVIRGNFLLTPLDLSRVDLRDKIHVEGVDFFLRSLNVSLKRGYLDPADVELVEA